MLPDVAIATTARAMRKAFALMGTSQAGWLCL
jgi:hypothetical protein